MNGLALLIAERERAARIEAELAIAKAKTSEDEALIAHQRLQIARLTRQLYGSRSERAVRATARPPQTKGPRPLDNYHGRNCLP
jgi:hypothetical protein